MTSSDNTRSGIEELRKLLFKKETSRIAAIEEIHDNHELYAQELAKVLAEAVQLRSQEGDDLGNALRPAIEEALNLSISENPKPLSDALFPVMGPAIRKAMQHAISAMLQSLTQSLEHAFSFKSLAWRWEAFRTGKSFAEVLMLHTLAYRVEQIFWIHKESGLLLKHISYDSALNEDADVVSGMLTAVGDFIQDSFSGDDGQEVNALRLGELEILLEQGPDSVLAVVCRGNPPADFREKINVALEHLHQVFHKHLHAFDGDTSTLEGCSAYLSPLMLIQYAKDEHKSPWKLLLGTAMMFLALMGYGGWGMYQDAQQEVRWQGYVTTLNHQDGILVTSAQKKDGHYYIVGLRDPLSVSPESLLQDFKLNRDVLDYQFEPYHALHPAFVLQRIQQRLQPPKHVAMHIEDGVLYVSGEASYDWIEKLHTVAGWLDGVHDVNDDALHEHNDVLARATAAIHPPESVVLRVEGSTLLMQGLATEAWLNHAKQALNTVRGISDYDDTAVQRMDAPAIILQQAIQLLQPPNSVHLYVTPSKRILAKGYASAEWITHAKTKAKEVAFAKSFDATRLQTTEAFILQRAIKVLQPPKSVHLYVTPSKRILAKGYASAEWIAHAKTKVKELALVQAFDATPLQTTEAMMLQRAMKVLMPPDSVQLHFSQGTLIASGKATQAWIQQAKEKYLAIDGVNTFDHPLQVMLLDKDILHASVLRLQPPKSIRLSFSQGVLHASGDAEPAWLVQAKKASVLVQGVQRFDASDVRLRSSSWEKLKQWVAHMDLATAANVPTLSAEDKARLRTLAETYKQALTLNPSSLLSIRFLFGRGEHLVAELRAQKILNALQENGLKKEQVLIHFQQNQQTIQASHITFKLLSGKENIL